MAQNNWPEDYQYILKQLKQARIDAELNQKQVAQKLSKEQSYIGKIESGERRIDIVELKKLAALYKKPIAFFLK